MLRRMIEEQLERVTAGEDPMNVFREPPEGDYVRGWGPPMVDRVSAVFFHLNRNKEGVRLDIRAARDRERLLELLKGADIFIEDVGQGRLRRLGLGAASRTAPYLT